MIPNQQMLFNAFLGLLVVIISFAALFGLVMYILQAIGMYTISKRRQLRLSAFAWIPILRHIKFAQISDDAVLNKSGNKPHMRILFPAFYIGGSIISCIGLFVFTISFSFSMLDLSMILQNPERFYHYTPRIISQTGVVIGAILFCLSILLGMAATVLQYICCFHIYRSTSTKFIPMFVLSFIFPFLISIFLFAVRNQDNVPWYIPGRYGQPQPPMQDGAYPQY